MLKVFFVIGTLTSSNFFYQAVFASPPDWMEATERSIFQAVAVIVTAYICRNDFWENF